MGTNAGEMPHCEPPRAGGAGLGVGWVLAVAAGSALAGAEPLLYVGAWLAFPGRWLAHFPQSVEVVGYLLAAGVMLGLAAVTMAIRSAIVRPSRGWWRLAVFSAVLLAATGIGCAAGWWAYMATWRV